MIKLVNLSAYNPGIASDETGINVEDFEFTTKPEAKEFLKGRRGQKIGFGIVDPEIDITIKGEINNSTGLMAATFTASTTIANTISDFYTGYTQGGIFMDEATVSSNRDPGKYRSLSIKLSSNVGIPSNATVTSFS